MGTYLFDDSKAKTVCDRYLADGSELLRAERQADVDGFLRVLRSDAGQDKLRVKESTRSGDATDHHVARVPERVDG